MLTLDYPFLVTSFASILCPGSLSSPVHCISSISGPSSVGAAACRKNCLCISFQYEVSGLSLRQKVNSPFSLYFRCAVPREYSRASGV